MGMVLIGYRGSGKTTVGKLLAARRKTLFVDTDDMIAAAAGKSIAAIFADEGEPAFRARESDAIQRAVQTPDAIISVGGGAVESAANRRVLQAYGPVVWLDAPAEMLWQRIQADSATAANRPALAGGGLEEVERVLERRRPWYRELATLIIPLGDNTPEKLSAQISAWLDHRNA
jgi:shikimate kinase